VIAPRELAELERMAEGMAREGRRLRTEETPVRRNWLASLQQAAPAEAAVLLANNSGRYVGANRPALALTGYTLDELLRLSVWDLTAEGKLAEFDKLWRAFLAAGTQRGTYDLLRRDGERVTVNYAAIAGVLPGVHASVLAPAVGLRPSPP
jgi:PAS domain S-box-containing protein